MEHLQPRSSESLFIVVSGLPASGKTTLARKLAHRLNMPLIDKDDFLERLFDAHEAVDEGLRSRLSRQSDEAMIAETLRSCGALLVSFWQHPEQPGTSGTPSAWLRSLPGTLIEIHCQFSAAQAREQFSRRSRHSGHNDAKRASAFLPLFDEIASRYPLGVGQVIEVEAMSVDDAQLASHILTITGRTMHL